jgi:hypothetical protein
LKVVAMAAALTVSERLRVVCGTMRSRMGRCWTPLACSSLNFFPPKDTLFPHFSLASREDSENDLNGEHFFTNCNTYMMRPHI